MQSKTFHSLRREITDRLVVAGIEVSEAATEADLILQHVTGRSRTELHLIWQTPLSIGQVAEIQSIVAGRERRIPLQYCLGHGWFDGLKIAVNSGVFIPRTDTETLVVVAAEMLSRSGSQPQQVGEIGIGSGAIALALLRRCPDLNMVACDISQDAINTARQNALTHGLATRLQLYLGDWRNVLPSGLQAIVSNPPYIPLSGKSFLEPEVRDHEPAEALFGSDEDGLGFYRDLAKSGAQLLVGNDGFVVVEVGDGQAEPVGAIFSGNNWRALCVHNDVNGLPRAVSALKPMMKMC